MVMFRQVLVEKNGKVVQLTNLDFNSLIRIMETVDYNGVDLANDRILYFDKENPSKYKQYDLHVLTDSHEMFDEAILFKLEPARIEASVERKEYLLQHMFTEAKTSASTTETFSSTTNEYESTIDKIDQMTVRLPEIEINSPINSSEDPDRKLLSIENIINLSSDYFIDKLEDDYESAEKPDYLEQAVDISFDSNEEKQMSYFEQMMLKNQQLILKKLDDMTIRFISLEQKVSYLYERQSIPIIIKLLTKNYLINIQQLDTRVLSSTESEHMHLFFRFVARHMNNDYENKWYSIKEWLGLSLNPTSIEYNLLGFGKWNKIDRRNLWKTIQSPIKSSKNIEIFNRSSYVSFENSFDDVDKNLIVVFEATTAKISFSTDILRDIADTNNKYSSSMKTLLHKFGQLERQVYYLCYYYSVDIHQFFAGLIFFELYRTPSIDPNQLLKNIMNSEVIQSYFPLLYQLFDLGQFIFTY